MNSFLPSTPWKPSPLVSVVTPPVFTAVEDIEMVRSASHEREQQQPVEQSVHTPHRPNEIVEAAALIALEHTLHEKQRQVEHCVRVLKREKEQRRVLEECAFVPPHELQKLRAHIQSISKLVMKLVRHLDQNIEKLMVQFIGNRWARNCDTCWKGSNKT